MRLRDEEIVKFKQLYLDEFGVDLPLEDVRASVSRVLILFEHFFVWLAKERAAGRCLDDVPPRTLPDA